MNTLNFTHPTAVATQTFNSLDTAMGDQDQYDLDDILVRRTSGQVASLFIKSPIGDIDLSQDPTGNLVDGIIYPRLDTPHDDERESVLGRPRQFPQTEADLHFINGLVKALHKI
jgi:hypothetical protein